MDKITTSDLLNKGVIGLPDTPGLDTTQMQQKFDEIALDVIVPHFNDLIDELEETILPATGDMKKSVYDTDNDGKVDAAEDADTVNSHTVESDVPADAVFTDTTYTAGTNITIDENNEISATDTTYTAGTNVSISDQNVISAMDTTYTAGSNISISAQNEISADLSSKMGTDGTGATNHVKFPNSITVGSRKSGSTIGGNSSALGYLCEASGNADHAEGNGTKASGGASHAEGYLTVASGAQAHAEGWGTTASYKQCHAEGDSTTASGDQAHAEGNETLASGDTSHAEGDNTIAAYTCQHVQGKYNDNKSTTLFEIGNGTADNARNNAFEVYSDGSLSQDNGTTKFKFTKYNNEDGYYDASGTFHAFGSGGGGSSTLSGLSDVSITSASNGQLLAYNTTSSKWENANPVDVSGKADKVSSPTNGDFAGLDSNGNLTDSGKKASDFCSVTAYDPNGTVATAGGIVAYIDTTITAALTASY